MVILYFMGDVPDYEMMRKLKKAVGIGPVPGKAYPIDNGDHKVIYKGIETKEGTVLKRVGTKEY